MATLHLTRAVSRSKHSSAWSTPELLNLLSIWGEEAVQSQLHSSWRNFNSNSQISHGMLEKGYEWDMQQCHAKIKEWRQVYQKARESNPHSGIALKTCQFYKELDTILGGRGGAATKRPVDTSVGLETVDSRISLKDEVVDKEVELEEKMEQVTGSSRTMGSQELFSTPEGSSHSQHSVSGVHDAGEGSSDVAFRGTPYTSAEHLHQIRK
ncbi:uncharacterized protein LOC142070672 [Caretta caretta]|uniref:uncharacterized protein LOC142070672 n=1 Tax=Caretta caretta TaxID=8467 RepID=UPI003F4B7A92